jgi:hypothetical protein
MHSAPWFGQQGGLVDWQLGSAAGPSMAQHIDDIGTWERWDSAWSESEVVRVPGRRQAEAAAGARRRGRRPPQGVRQAVHERRLQARPGAAAPPCTKSRSAGYILLLPRP